MLDPRICPGCGDRANVPIAEPGEPVLRCARCGHRWRFHRLPLLALTGPSGAGKSTVGPELARRLADRVVVLEQDVLWTGGLRDDVDGHPTFRATWLRMAAMIHQSGRPVVLCGTVVPPEFEPLPERVFFADIHYLALVADSDVLARRLAARPAWREWSRPRIEEMLEFNEWLRAEASALRPPVRLFDTTHASRADAVAVVESWVRELLPATPDQGAFR
ncbi:Broad-specificity NMP kinase [Amycolatopsis arida]|uniref:Broad-specificity NMP kinase n=1 Tax=Amycolatopsis arida TaxID=587909 RepID=A0A1I5YC14_9PSEU|nr:AAA family ATPase [Amycolatopsis arida]TDX90411.1 broad-specificity NMP kinase [Amycolatopsis arida]SFQ41670.1 Broad-specificity NMP kinase [Amycolatopsis arida]